MLPRTTWRITAPPLRRHAFRAYSSTSTATASDASTPTFGDEFGAVAGPSRLPYTPAPSRRKNTRNSANALRRSLEQLEVWKYQGPWTIDSIIAQMTATDDKEGSRTLSRLEKHVLLHHLIRKRKGRLAVNFAHQFVLERIHSDRNPRDSLISSTSLDRLFKGQMWSLRRGKPRPTEIMQREPKPDPLPQPTIEEQRPHDLSSLPQAWINFLGVLREYHHPRPERLYRRLIHQCVQEGRPDEAANVYASLVEDWIMEGRVAEGADPEDFGRGGLPAANAQPKSKALFNVWFGTVRTWRFPGEAMSLHDRLDLWHPQQAAPDECLRGFPLPNPTSPPSQVPSPSEQLLLVILKSLQLDPHIATPVEYASSMRALAILANTILSRSLPIPAIPRLLRAFSTSHIHPAVYPLSFTQPPEHNAWAYTANTQVHVALVSLLFSPPNYARAAEIQRLAIEEQPPSPQGAAQYSLHPLGWQSCLVLMNYAVHKLMQPRLLSSLIDYMKSRFKGWSPSIFTRLFRSATTTRDNQLAMEVEHKLFKNSGLSAENIDETAKRAGYIPPRRRASIPTPHAILHDETPSLPLPETDGPTSNDVVALIHHMVATSQFERLRKTVFTLIPFLSINADTPRERIEEIAAATGAEIGFDGRLPPSWLTPSLYTVIINGLVKSGQTGLAQRVYFLAEQSEDKYVRRMIAMAQEEAVERGEDPSEVPIHLESLAAIRLPIHLYTSMLNLYGAEARKRGWREGWKVPVKFAQLNRSDAGQYMARRLYRHVIMRRKALAAKERQLNAHILPDEWFFNAAIRVFSLNWHLEEQDQGYRLPPTTEKELVRVLNDMVAYEIDPPRGLIERLYPPYRVVSPIYLEVEKTRHRPQPDVLKSLSNYQVPALQDTYEDPWGDNSTGQWSDDGTQQRSDDGTEGRRYNGPDLEELWGDDVTDRRPNPKKE